MADRPKPEPKLEVYRRAFSRLSRARGWIDGVPQPIPLSEMLSYCDGIGLTGAAFREQFLDLVQDMDGAFIEHVDATRAAETDTDAKSDVVQQ